jgi:hypothetical protein
MALAGDDQIVRQTGRPVDPQRTPLTHSTPKMGQHNCANMRVERPRYDPCDKDASVKADF